ncbi:MAG TPA: outer membrane beta-barrel protein [Ohtaekwangia sp.]|uniref:outer membrane beta-barrel protein n=1 Tax=Ohtaekwangia sp. TaxID=2066019 RepID=UPI002F959B9C
MKKLYLLLFCFLLAANVSLAQSSKSKKRKSPAAYNKQNKENERFLEKQWWLGVKGGMNLTKVNVVTNFSIIAPTNYDASESGKKYKNFNLVGSQFTMEAMFYFKRFTFSLQPTYQHSRFAYSNQYKWISTAENNANSVELKYNQEQKVDHVLIPLLVKYEFGSNKLRPYLQIGIFQAIRVSATKAVTVSGIDQASGGKNEFSDETVTVGAKDLFAKNYWGFIAGAGAYYTLGNNVRLNLDVQYKYGMSNISSTKNRYSNDRLAGIGDAMDDLNMDNLAISVGCLFPLRFLESGFKSLDRK